jgi:hypothetical protein
MGLPPSARFADRPEPELAELSGAFDPHENAREVALDLRRMYGDRLRAVLLFSTEAGPEARAGRGIAGRVTALSRSREEIAAARLLAEGGFGSRAISRA